MKAWIFPNLIQFSGIGLGFFMMFAAIQSGVPAFEQVAAMSAGVGMMAFLYALGASFETLHIKKILKKKGLWEDDEIRKKDLPK